MLRMERPGRDEPARREIAARDRRLDSWKAIAEYLGRCCRTVQRWHFEMGLPVRHVGGKRGPVYSYSDELDEWLRTRGQGNGEQVREGVSDVEHPWKNGAPQVTHPVQAGSAKERAESLVAYAQRMWEVLSYRNVDSIVRLYREASELDPDNAEACAGLASALTMGSCLGNLHPKVARPAATASLERAMRHDPKARATRRACAWLRLLFTREWQAAKREFDELISEAPLDGQALAGRALVHLLEGSAEAAVRLLSSGPEGMPLSTPGVGIFCWSLYLSGRHDEALEALEQARSVGETGPVLDAVEALTLVQLGDLKKHIGELEALTANSPGGQFLRGVLGYAYCMIGRRREAQELLELLSQDSERKRQAYSIALILVGLGEISRAVYWLERACTDGSFWSLGFRTDPILAPISTEDSFLSMMSKLQYPPLREETFAGGAAAGIESSAAK